MGVNIPATSMTDAPPASTAEFEALPATIAADEPPTAATPSSMYPVGGSMAVDNVSWKQKGDDNRIAAKRLPPDLVTPSTHQSWWGWSRGGARSRVGHGRN